MGKVYISCTDKEWSDMEDGKINVIDYKGVEYVRVVRCKDCTRYVPFKDIDGVCLAHNTGVLIVMSQNGYCNLGERKEDGDN